MPLRYLLSVAVGSCLWGCWSLFLRPAGLTGAQNAVLALTVMTVPLPFVLRRAAFKDRRATAAVAIVGLADAGNMALFFAAVQRGPVSIAVLTHYLAPLLVALTAPWVLREPRSVRSLVGTPVTLAGLTMLLQQPGGGPGFSFETAALGAGSAVFYAAIILGTKEASRAYSPLAITAVHAPLSILVLLIFFGTSALPPALDLATARVLAGGVVCGLGGCLLFNTGLSGVSTAKAGALTYLEPLTASVVGWVAFDEALSSVGMLGGVLVLAAGIWVAGEPRAKTHPAPASSGAP